MAKSRTVGTAAELRRAKKLLEHYDKDVTEAAREFRRTQKASSALGAKFAEGLPESDVPRPIQEVLSSRGPISAAYFAALIEMSRARLLPLRAEVYASREELASLLSEKEHMKLARAAFLGDLRKERHAALVSCKKKVVDLESANADLSRSLQLAHRHLQSLERNLARRERGLLRWFEKTQSLRLKVASQREKIENLRDGLQQCDLDLESARYALVVARENQKTEKNHPELLAAKQKLGELTTRAQVTKRALAGLNRKLQITERGFGEEVVRSAAHESQQCNDRLIRVTNLVPALCAPLPEDGGASDAWVVACKNLRAEAVSLLGMPVALASADGIRDRRDSVIKSLVAHGIRQDRSKQQERVRKAERAKERAQEIAREARAREKQRIKRDQEIASANRRELQRLTLRRQNAVDALNEFEREHRRLDSRLDQIERARDRAASRVLRVLSQAKARNPGFTPEHLRQNRPRFPAYDNAQAAVEELETERLLTVRLIAIHQRLKAATSEAERRLAAEIRSQSSAPKGRSGRAPKIEVNEWEDAERLAELYMQHLGFQDARRTTDGPDGGIDVESAHAVAQVKDQSNPVGRHLVQQLYGVARSKDKKAFFFARRYAPQAVNWAHANDVTLYVFSRAGDVELVR